MAVPVLVPEGKTMLDLTLGELDAASFHLKSDVAECINGEVPGKRYAATVELLYRWAHRRDPKVKREDFREYDLNDAMEALGMNREVPPDAEGQPDPTSAESGSEPNESS